MATTYTLVGIFFVTINWIPTESMEDTIKARSVILIDKYSYGACLPRRFADIPLLKYVLYFVPYFVYDYDQHSDWGYHRTKIQRMPHNGDIIVFISPRDSVTYLCKRIVAQSGDTLEIKRGVVFVNGRRLNVPKTVLPTIDADTIYSVLFPKGSTWTTHNYGPLVIPGTCSKPLYFVLGDNRRHSIDSRTWGYVRFDSIKGRILYHKPI